MHGGHPQLVRRQATSRSAKAKATKPIAVIPVALASSARQAALSKASAHALSASSVPAASASTLGPVIVTVTPSPVAAPAATSTPQTAMQRFGAGGLAGIIAGGIVVLGILIMCTLGLIRRSRKRKQAAKWWNSPAGGTLPPVLGDGEKPLMSERDPDRSSDTLVDDKATSIFQRSKSSASAKSGKSVNGAVSPFAVDAMPMPSPGLMPTDAPPARPRRPSATDLEEQMRRKKDTIISFEDAPPMPTISHALPTPRQSVAGNRLTVVAPAPVQSGYVSTQRRSHQPDLNAVLESLADPKPAGFSQSAGSLHRKARPSTLVGLSQPLGSAPDGLSPITEASSVSTGQPTPAPSAAFTSSVRSREGYSIRQQTMSVQSAAGIIDTTSPTAAAFNRLSPAPISPLPPLTPFEHVPVLGLATLPAREASLAEPPTPSLVSASAEASPRMSEGFALTGIGASFLADGAEEMPALPRIRTPTADASMPTTPGTADQPTFAKATFGRQSGTSFLQTDPAKDFAPLSQMNLAKQQPNYRSPTLSLYGAYSADEPSLL